MDRRLALVTGASAGIGAALARSLAARGYDLALTARRRERLDALADEVRLRFGVEALVLPDDLADPASPGRILAAVDAAGRDVDALINNAGYGLPGVFVETGWQEQADFLQVMLHAPTELSHRVLAGMTERRFGRILNVASLAGLLPGTRGHTLYAATKAYLVRFSQSLHLETRPLGVHVSALCPGFTWSEFHDVNGTRDLTRQSTPAWLWMGADEVAEVGVEALEANRPVCVPGAPNKAIAALAKLLPEDWVLALVEAQSGRFRKP
ncbi:MAG: SDR family oxidoreductase [Phenylobacterium sp.]|uniref:SDR family NAD(P)-dependent oxidoreductase n=1 Tax=Phenylobacterium sp. TaxID=1871053 RepID=UPI0025CF44E6|nr:SDR family oxidoreductase [Phenylobacterium sp.]MCA3711399.1 SDR family oxidoreductase [Phenylobacterium sp.]MCA3724775.1 SDR family oxidoreductase [Phenylobacterium sp.]MCA3725519.1 SDR family oxidoreductase [Phenylobacterium sp.]MCA6240056.1 SDR family oxidoreductase [Phenylobacterium sp.]MCA6261248.1 SDR family oxidoreductase [Phenylobacterium sp.]